MGTVTRKNINTGYPICLYTTPTTRQNKIWKRNIDIIGHWAICINGYCYELARLAQGVEKTYGLRFLPEEEWKRIKRLEGRRITERDPLGYTARRWTHEDIKRMSELIWNGPLRNTYHEYRTNCQVFVLLLVNLVGNNDVKVSFPTLFSEMVKDAGIARDLSYFALTGAVVGGGSVIAGMSLIFSPIDPTTVLGACAVTAGSAALKATNELWEGRNMREQYIARTQAELRAQLVREGILS
ncbi:hypothetical protein FVEN_g6512 [Fusarium venenatum]|uniref:Uncharacterized protein n=1 Tax=Fusarium venenatum TaxID=56646 RepID=A0A2L2T5Q0_9HYPO|nr:uncharacterized protein FVRRES_04797 [Fusarium venenatum]KAG8355793.1 hypothetical protein FVEN_g6512 [Fusarium venenatum]KAH6991942.1 hypothetical protein EDB82DRAFT_494766 [Fusarium venenatum]CEI60361.1 unnamed protein product [Fusarium venenatum]